MKAIASREFRRLVDAWFETLRQTGRVAVTLETHQWALADFDESLRRLRGRPTNALAVTPGDVELWRQALVNRDVAPSSLDRLLGPLVTFFRWLEKTGRIFTNPCRFFAIPRYHRRLLSVPSERDILRVLEAMKVGTPRGERDKAMLEILYGAGLRRRELSEMTLKSIDWNACTVRIEGKGRERVVPLTWSALNATRSYCAHGRVKLLGGRSSDLMWISKNSPRPILIHEIGRIVRRAGKAVGVKLGPQTLRRAFATHMLARGASLEDLRILLGHSTYDRLQHYLRYAPRDLIAAHRSSSLGK